MNADLRIDKYLDHWSHAADRPLTHGNSLEGIEQAVVIPALAEKDTIFSTLASLSRNDPGEIARTLVLVVVNNRPFPYSRAEDILNNIETLHDLNALQQGRLPVPHNREDRESADAMEEILDSGLRMAVIDASSPGREMPVKTGGVGFARRLGMDAALACLHRSGGDFRCLLSLDADTLVEENYLEESRRFLRSGNWPAATVDFAHRFPSGNPREGDAIRRYEVFLRYYRLGLCYAGSPYSFFTIGSAIVCRDQAYAAVRGMPIRNAAEDFYFLNKLAKIGPIGRIGRTRVHPSSRRSARVPFGTGRSVSRYLDGDWSGDRLYDPDVFVILREWLLWMERNIMESEDAVLAGARGIHPALPRFLEESGFPVTWRQVRRNTRRPDAVRRHFRDWFDGFRTLKLIHFFTEREFPRIEAFTAVDHLCRLLKKASPVSRGENHHHEDRWKFLLEHLKDIQAEQDASFIA